MRYQVKKKSSFSHKSYSVWVKKSSTEFVTIPSHSPKSAQFRAWLDKNMPKWEWFRIYEKGAAKTDFVLVTR